MKGKSGKISSGKDLLARRCLPCPLFYKLRGINNEK
tara:strand:- start:537 stop:644 length:108 start_codon:yes stop_codon:yes gene_type:complete